MRRVATAGSDRRADLFRLVSLTVASWNRIGDSLWRIGELRHIAWANERRSSGAIVARPDPRICTRKGWSARETGTRTGLKAN